MPGPINPYWRLQCSKRGVTLTHTHFFDCSHGHTALQCCYCGLSEYDKPPEPEAPHVELNIALQNWQAEPKLALGRPAGEDEGPGRGPLTEAQRRRLGLLAYLTTKGKIGGFGDE